MNIYLLGIITVLTILISSPSQARERDPLIGPYPYDFRERSNVQGSLILHESRRRGSGRYGKSSGNDSIPTTIIQNYSNSYSVGNWQQIEMILADGAEGLIMTESHQDSSGATESASQIQNQLNGKDNNPMLNQNTTQ